MEAIIGILLIVIAALEIAFIIWTVSRNMPAAVYAEPIPRSHRRAEPAPGQPSGTANSPGAEMAVPWRPDLLSAIASR